MHTRQLKLKSVDWRVYAIADPSFVTQGRTFLDSVRSLLEGGAGVIQLRDKIHSTREIFESALELRALCHEFGALFIVNDRLDIALAAGADGVHLGPNDLPVQRARAIAPELIIGASAGTVDRAVELAQQGADYLGIGAIFEARSTKPDASSPRGPEIITAVRENLPDLPLIGIGGINADNAASVLQAGASGVAAIRELLGAECPRTAAQELRTICAKVDKPGA